MTLLSIDRRAQRARAEHFRALHDPRDPLFLVNAWDALSARVIEAAGYPAAATTSAGVAWSLGYADGEFAPREDIVAATARIARVLSVPLTADIEAGFGATPAEVGATVAAIVDAGAVGINIEDSLPGDSGLRSIDAQADRIRAARAAADALGVPIVINARTDLYLGATTNERARFDESVARALAYVAAGADCVYPIGLADAATIRTFVAAVRGPVNITARPGLPTRAELGALGVARVSAATAGPRIAMAALSRLAREAMASGDFEGLVCATTHSDMQTLLAQR